MFGASTGKGARRWSSNDAMNARHHALTQASAALKADAYTIRQHTPRVLSHGERELIDTWHASKGAKLVHYSHVSWSRYTPKGKRLDARTLASAMRDMMGGSTIQFEMCAAKLRAQGYTFHEVRQCWIALRKGGSFAPTRPVKAAEAGILILDAETRTLVNEATFAAREASRTRAKADVLFAAHRATKLTAPWARLSGHVRHCACHSCVTLDKAVRGVIRTGLLGTKAA